MFSVNWLILFASPVVLHFGTKPFLRRRLRKYEIVFAASWVYLFSIVFFYNLSILNFVHYPPSEIEIVWKWIPAIPAIFSLFIRRLDYASVDQELIADANLRADAITSCLSQQFEHLALPWTFVKLSIPNDDWRLPRNQGFFVSQMTTSLSDLVTLVLHAEIRLEDTEEGDLTTSADVILSARVADLEGFCTLEKIESRKDPSEILSEIMVSKHLALNGCIFDKAGKTLTINGNVITLHPLSHVYTQVPWRKIDSLGLHRKQELR
jgi:hypothetical protein